MIFTEDPAFGTDGEPVDMQEYVERANQMVKAQQSSDLQISKPASCAGSAVLGGGEWNRNDSHPKFQV